MKPFLLIGTRGQPQAALEEYQAFVLGSGLSAEAWRWHRLDEVPLGALDLRDYSGVVLGGSPFTVSDPLEAKSTVQIRCEAELRSLIERVVAHDFPFLGACYGIGVLGGFLGGHLSGQYSEPVSATAITVTEAGSQDPLFAGLPQRFDAFVGHKEALGEAPPGSVLLAQGTRCPVQAFRVGRNVYATQFHPELDVAGVCSRVRIYREYGYFEPTAVDAVIESLADAQVSVPLDLLRRFVAYYAQSSL